MNRKSTRPVALRREGERRRRFPFWIIPVLLIVALSLSGGYWLFRPRIERALERPATLPPPPPTLTPSAGDDQTPGRLAEPGRTADPGQAAPPGLIYQTDFENEAQFADWEQYDDGIISAQIVDGQLVVDVDALSDTPAWSGLNYTFDDFVLEVDATKLAGPDDNGILIIFRLTDSLNYNRFDISSDGYYTVSMVRGGVPRVVSDWNTSPAINTGDATNHITLNASGEMFSFAVNGETLKLCVSYEEGVQPLWNPATGECLGGNITDVWRNTDLPRGRVGLGAQGFTGFDGENTTPAQATIGFDNLVITRPGR